MLSLTKASTVIVAVLAAGLIIVGYQYYRNKQVNQPAYKILRQQSKIELRQYPSLLLAQVKVTGDRDKAARKGFRILASFIFGNNNNTSTQQSTKISMTAPVLQQISPAVDTNTNKDTIKQQAQKSQQSTQISMTAPVLQQAQPTQQVHNGESTDSNKVWLVSFVMPAQYSLVSIPQPIDSNIKLHQMNDVKVAAIRFSGRWKPDAFKQQQQKLLEFINQNNLQTQGNAIYAYYNPPWTLPMLRRNEVMFILKN